MPDFVLADILKWLNGRAKGAARARGILEMLKEFGKSNPRDSNRADALNARLKRYQSFPFALSDLRGSGRIWIDERPLKRNRTPRSYKETFVVRKFVDFAKAGMLGGFRRCEHCTAWFFAKTGIRQRFCCKLCRETFRKSPDGREERRAYMRSLREMLNSIENRK